MVLAGVAANVASIRGEIEHVPKVGGPKVGAFLKRLVDLVVANELVLLAIIASTRFLGVDIGHAFSTIFGEAKRLFGEE